MTDILLEWLNKEVKLSKQIKNIAEDFSSGFLFGEILHKYKEITNFQEYQNKTDPEIKIKNLKLVEKAFRDLEIKIEKDRIKDIAECKKGVAARFLFQIKMKLSKKEIDFDNLMMKNSNQLYDLYKSIKYPNQNEKYLVDAKNRSTIMAYTAKSPSRKLLRMKSDKQNIPTHNEFHVLQDIMKDEEYFKKLKQHKLAEIHNEEKSYHLSKIEKDKKELDNWKDNIKHMQEFEAKRKENYMRDVNYFRTAALESISKSAVNTEIQIDAFDKILAKLGLDIAIIDPKLKKPSKNLMSSELILQKIRDRLAMDLSAKKERDRRKRKMNVEQTKAQIELEKKKEELEKRIDSATNEMKVDIFSSVYEKRLEYENWRNLHSLEEKAEKKRMKLHKLIRNEAIITDKNYDNIFDSLPNAFEKETFFETLKKENLKYRELALQEKKIKREKNYKICGNIFSQLLDLVDECFQIQKTNSGEFIDVKEWRNLMQSFIDHDIVNSNRSNSETSKGLISKQTFDFDSATAINNSNFNSSTNMPILSEYEENELYNYIYFKGRWNKNLITESVLNKTMNVRDVLDLEYLYKLYGNKTKSSYRNLSDKALNIELRDEDIENLTIPSDNTKNLLFGEIIDIITEIKFSLSDNVNKLSHTQIMTSIFSHIPVKISLIGHSFSGKKTQAKLLLDNYSNIKIYDIDSLIKKSIETLEKLEIPLEANSKYKTFKKNQLEQMEKEREMEVEKFKDIKTVISPIRDAIKHNEPVKDEWIVNFILESLKQDFPEKDPNQISDDIFKKQKRRKEILEELAKIKEEQIKKPKIKVKEEQLLNAELIKLNMDSNKGFLIVDFPRTLEQAKILERKLTGYVQEIEKPKTQIQQYKDTFAILIDRILKPSSAKQIRESGLDTILCIDVSSKECIRRAVGRRIDPNTGIIYHLEDNPPPSNDNKLKDRLQLVDDANSNEQQLKIKHLEFDNNITKIKEFYEIFGNQKYSIKSFNQINGECNKTNLQSEILEYVMKLKKISEDREVEIVSVSREKEKNYNIGNLDSTQNVLNIHTPRSNNDQAVLVNVNSNIPQIFQYGNQSETRDFVDINYFNPPEEEEAYRFTKKLDDARRKLSLSIIENIFINWNKIYENYTKEAKIVFRDIKKLKDNFISNFYKLQLKFMKFLKRPSKKLNEVSKYQTKYNNFGEEYPKLREDNQVKQEFHKDVTELTEKIWEIIETRKNEAIDERSKIMNSGKAEKEMEKFYNSVERLFSIEIEKFLASIQIIREFYIPIEFPRNLIQVDLTSMMNLSNFIKSSEFIPPNISQISLEGMNESDNSPRIEKLFNNCLKLVFVLEERLQTIDKNLKSIIQQNTSGDIQSIVKKHHRFFTIKKSHIDSSFLENKFESSYDEEMKSAIKNEKNKFKFRISLITFWGINTLKTMRKMASLIYNSFDNWIIDTVKAENDAMNNLIFSLRSHIEKETNKIKVDNKELDGFEMYKISDVTEFWNLNPLDNADFNQTDCSPKINLEKFKEIFNHVKTFEIQKNLIRTSVLFDLLILKQIVESHNDGIYHTIRNLTFHNYNKFIKAFEVIGSNSYKSNGSNNNLDKKNESYLE